MWGQSNGNAETNCTWNTIWSCSCWHIRTETYLIITLGLLYAEVIFFQCWNSEFAWKLIYTLTCLLQGHTNIVKVVFKSACVCACMRLCGDAKKNTVLQQRMVNFVLYGPGRNDSSPQSVSWPLQEKSPAPYCCLEILTPVEVYRFFYPLKRDIFSDSLQSVVTFEFNTKFFHTVVLLVQIDNKTI
jgi:hypothetical protein